MFATMLPSEEFFPVLREQWGNFGLRDAIVQRLAAHPDAADRDKFLFGVDSGNTQVAKVCVQALEKLPACELLDELHCKINRLGHQTSVTLMRNR